MANTGNPAIANTTSTFSGTSSSSYTGDEYYTKWEPTTTPAKYASTTSVSGDGGTAKFVWDHVTYQPTDADYGARAVYYVHNYPGTNQIGLYVRAYGDGNDTGYRFLVQQNGQWQVDRVNAGTATAIASGDYGEMQKATGVDIEFYASGSSPVVLKAYVEGVLLQDGSSQAGETGRDVANQITAQGEAVFIWPKNDYFECTRTELRTEDVAATFNVTDIPASESIGIGTSSTLSLSSYVTGGTLPYSYSINTGTLPTGLTLNASTGDIEGTATTAEEQTVSFDIEDSAGTPASDTTSSITFYVTAAVNDPPQWAGTDIPDFNLTEGVPHAGLDISNYWTDTDIFTVAEDTAYQAWPTGVSISSGAIVIDEATISAGGPTTVRAKATDSISQVSYSNTFSITVTAASSGTVTTPALDNGTESGPILGESVEWVYLPTDPYDAAGGTSTLRGTGTTNATTGTLTISGTIPLGSGFLVVGDLAWDNWWIGKVTSA